MDEAAAVSDGKTPEHPHQFRRAVAIFASADPRTHDLPGREIVLLIGAGLRPPERNTLQPDADCRAGFLQIGSGAGPCWLLVRMP